MTDRGVSVTVNYVLTIAITAILLSGLFVASGSLLQTQSERAIQDELEVLGERFAADISTADRLAESAEGEDVHVRVTTELPRRVAGTTYSIEITDGDPTEIVLRTNDPGIESSTTVATADVAPVSGIQGGNLVIEFTAKSLTNESRQLEVTAA